MFLREKMKRGFEEPELSREELEELKALLHLCRGDILTMTFLAGSGHPGGSLSSLEMVLLVYGKARISPEDPWNEDRDRIVVSHGHISPAVYSVLGRLGFLPIEEALSTFRLAGSPYEGHVNSQLPGIEWSTGNLGQGLAAGCGFALAGKIKGKKYHTFVLMSDGEQTKGPVSEARRFAIKYGLKDLTVIIDYNRLQISGKIDEVMPQRIRENYEADAWEVIEVDGHDLQELYKALRKAIFDEKPTAIIAHTVMGKGISFMENNNAYHGRALTPQEYEMAMKELGLEVDLNRLRELRKRGFYTKFERPPVRLPKLDTGTPKAYSPGEKVGNRKAWGRVLLELAELNIPRGIPIVALDCDLQGSVMVEEFGKRFPSYLIEGGVQEHSTAIIAGVLSREGIITFFADFGVFNIDEVYNQQRLNDINRTNLKVIATHTGLDVGQDGNTHHCIDYLGLMRNLFGFKVIVSADPNHTDRIIRWVAQREGNFLITMGREPEPVIEDEEGRPFFGQDYVFCYGKGDLLRKGTKGALISMGTLLNRAVKVADLLRKEGLDLMVINISCPFDLDKELLNLAASTGLIITYEDHHVETGLGAEVAKFLAENGYSVRFRRLGIRGYGLSGIPEELYRHQGLDEDSLIKVIREEVKGCNSKRFTTESFLISSRNS